MGAWNPVKANYEALFPTLLLKPIQLDGARKDLYSRHAAIHARDGHDLDDDLVLSGRGRVANYGAGSLSMDAGLDRSADVPVPPRTNKNVMNQ